jgi:hypothetical protein
MGLTIEQEGKKAEKEAIRLGKSVVQYAKALYEKQPKLPVNYNNGRISGPKDKWTFEECVFEAVMVMYKESKGFVEPMIVGTYEIDVQEVWNVDNNYKRNHAQ